MVLPKYGISGEAMSHIPSVALLVLSPLCISFKSPQAIMRSPLRSDPLGVIYTKLKA